MRIMLNKIVHFINTKLIKRFVNHYEQRHLVTLLGYYAKGAALELPDVCTCPSKIYLYENTNIYKCARFIINPVGDAGRFIMKKNSGAAQGLTIVTGNHAREKGVLFKTLSANHQIDIDKDIIVEEDVWIGANVTLLSGVTIGRGASIGAGSVCLKSIPPYAVVMGNPAKVLGFNYSPEEIVEHENKLYPEEERIPKDVLEKNYNKFFINRIKEIKEFTKI